MTLKYAVLLVIGIMLLYGCTVPWIPLPEKQPGGEIENVTPAQSPAGGNENTVEPEGEAAKLKYGQYFTRIMKFRVDAEQTLSERDPNNSTNFIYVDKFVKIDRLNVTISGSEGKQFNGTVYLIHDGEKKELTRVTEDIWNIYNFKKSEGAELSLMGPSYELKPLPEEGYDSTFVLDGGQCTVQLDFGGGVTVNRTIDGVPSKIISPDGKTIESSIYEGGIDSEKFKIGNSESDYVIFTYESKEYLIR